MRQLHQELLAFGKVLSQFDLPLQQRFARVERHQDSHLCTNQRHRVRLLVERERGLQAQEAFQRQR